jgi:hypothetical protein
MNKNSALAITFISLVAAILTMVLTNHISDWTMLFGFALFFNGIALSN